MASKSKSKVSPGLGFERIQHHRGSTFQDNSTVIIIPTRGMVHNKVVQSLMSMVAPMNTKRCIIWAEGDEVGKAYSKVIKEVLAHPDLSKWKYVLTLEDDNIQPPDAHIRLLESIELGPFDAVSGIYFTKGEVNMPMAYGDPAHYAATGELEFRPRDIRQALQTGSIMEVNGIAMGCSLYRMDMFRQIEGPWFVTVADWEEGKGGKSFTQDLYFCERAKKAGKRFAVDMRVHVGHLDINTGVVY